MSAHGVKKLINSSTNNVEVHSLPFNVDYNGTSKVDEYFKSSMAEEKNPQNGKSYHSASFRGRPLKGASIEVPESYKDDTFEFWLNMSETKTTTIFLRGVVIKEEKTNNSNVNDFHVDSTFEQMTYWNLETVPSNDDALLQALEWIKIANALHDELEDEEEQTL